MSGSVANGLAGREQPADLTARGAFMTGTDDATDVSDPEVSALLAVLDDEGTREVLEAVDGDPTVDPVRHRIPSRRDARGARPARF